MPDTDEAVRALLHAAADPPGGPLSAPVNAVLFHAHRRQLRRRGALLGSVAVVAAIAVAVPVVVASTRDERAVPSHPSPTPSASVNLGTVDALAGDHWSALPRAPIAPRSGAAAVWTGKQMLIWGGGDQGKALANLRSDGATYDPANRTWRTTADAPIGPRYLPAYAWTGSELFVWGGEKAGPLHTMTFIQDGAVYDPTARTWRKVAAAPLPALGSAQAVAINGSVLVLGELPGENLTRVVAAIYDPAKGTWGQLPDLPDVGVHVRLNVRLMASADAAYVFVDELDDPVPPTGYGVDAFELARGSSAWKALPHVAADSADGAPMAIAGRLVLGAGASEVHFSQPPGLIEPGRTLLLGDTSWRRLPAGPIDADYPAWISTGDAMIGSVLEGDDRKLGSTAAWDPLSRAWTLLPRAPLYPYYLASGMAEVWTGRELLVWGRSYYIGQPRPATFKDAVGLQFGP